MPKNKLLVCLCILTICFYLTKAEYLGNTNQNNNYNNGTEEYVFKLILRHFYPREKTLEVECNDTPIEEEGIKMIEIPKQKWREGLTEEEYEKHVKPKISSCNCLLEPLARGTLSIEERGQRSEEPCKNYIVRSQFPWPAIADELREYEMRVGDRLQITDPNGNSHSLEQPMNKVIRIKPGQVTLRCRKRSKNLPLRPTFESLTCPPSDETEVTEHTISHYRIIFASLIGSLVMNMCIILIVILVWKNCKGNNNKNKDSHHRTGSRGNYNVARMSYEVPTRPYNNQESNSSTPSSPNQYTPLQTGGTSNLAMDMNNHIITLNNKPKPTEETSDDISAYEPYHNNNMSQSTGKMMPVNNMPLKTDDHPESEYINRGLGELYTIQEEANSPDTNKHRSSSNDNFNKSQTHQPVSGLRRQSSSYDYIIDDDSDETDKHHVKRNSSLKYLELT